MNSENTVSPGLYTNRTTILSGAGISSWPVLNDLFNLGTGRHVLDITKDIDILGFVGDCNTALQGVDMQIPDARRYPERQGFLHILEHYDP